MDSVSFPPTGGYEGSKPVALGDNDHLSFLSVSRRFRNTKHQPGLGPRELNTVHEVRLTSPQVIPDTDVIIAVDGHRESQVRVRTAGIIVSGDVLACRIDNVDDGIDSAANSAPVTFDVPDFALLG